MSMGKRAISHFQQKRPPRKAEKDLGERKSQQINIVPRAEGVGGVDRNFRTGARLSLPVKKVQKLNPSSSSSFRST